VTAEATILVNGGVTQVPAEHRISLADFLRDKGATSVHLGCEHGVCGACNVLLDGVTVRSCLVMARSCTGASVCTLEGLNDELAERLRVAFTKHHALQCGFCTPGVFVAAHELLSGGTALDEPSVRERMSGNICRCTGYQGIVDAVLEVAGGLPLENHT
jgi:aerobic-type carbon monoxide dehydrogenase small subunit (CoxS/CutS family)